MPSRALSIDAAWLSGGRRRHPGLLLPLAALAGATLGGGAGAHPAAPERGAPGGQRAEAFVTGPALERLAQKLLPLRLELPGRPAEGIPPTSLSVDEAIYCGAVGPDRGRILAVVRSPPAAGAPAPAPRLAGAADCPLGPSELAGRGGGAAGTDAAVVVELLASWRPWRLELALGASAATSAGAMDGAAPGSPSSIAQALARARAGGPLVIIETSSLDLATGAGAAQRLAVAIAFAPGRAGLRVVAVPAAPAPGRPPAPWSPRSPSPPAPVLSGGADTQLTAGVPFANRLLGSFTADGPLVLTEEGQTVELRELQLTATEGLLTVRGRATSRELQESMRLTIESRGGDLEVSQVRAEAELESCADSALMAQLGCRARNAARTAAATATAGALTSRYRGQPLRSLSSPPATSLELGGLRLRARLTPTQIQSRESAVSLSGRLELELERP